MRDMQREKETETFISRNDGRDSQRYRKSQRHIKRQRQRDRKRQTERQRQRQKETETERQRQRDRGRQREINERKNHPYWGDPQ